MLTAMRTVTTIEDVRALADGARSEGKVVGLVPTMGYLHDGHLSLMAAARRDCDLVVATIFVNPLQFAPDEDLAAYPRDPDGDAAKAAGARVHVLFMPGNEEMYPRPVLTTVSVAELSQGMEGATRPTHFDGVSTVVTKLFAIVGPCRAYFGEKDYQQLLLIRGMVEAFFLPVEIVPCTTVRADDGLALSSRNERLSAEGRILAPDFHRVLASAADSREARDRLSELGFQVDYVVDSDGRRFGAVMVDGVRLIDNLPLSHDEV